MKKALFAILATVAMVACSNDEIVREAAPEAISFDTFVEKATRSVVDPSYTATTVPNFGVNAFVSNAVLLDDERVTNDNGVFTYTNTQYWIDEASYQFAAVSPYYETVATLNEAQDEITTTLTGFTNTSDGIDLLYAFDEAVGKASNNELVALDFRHCLSKVKFSFENQYPATNTSVKVSNIVLKNSYVSGDVVLKEQSTVWSNQNGELLLDFGMATDKEGTEAKEGELVYFGYGTTYESYNERLLIPGLRQYEVAFDVTIRVSGVDIKKFPYEITVNADLEPGHAYDFKGVITAGEEIKFSVNSIDGWE